MNQLSSAEKGLTPVTAVAEISGEQAPGEEGEGVLSAKVFTLHELPILLKTVEKGAKTQNGGESERFYNWLKEVTANGDSFTIATPGGDKTIHISQMRENSPEVAALLRDGPMEETETRAAEAIPKTPVTEETVSAEENINNAPAQPEDATKSRETEEADFQQALEKAETIDDIVAAMRAKAAKNSGLFRMNMSRQNLSPDTVEAMIRGENGYSQNMINDYRLQQSVTRVMEKIAEERTKEETPKELEAALTTKQHETEEPTNPATPQEQETPIIENNISIKSDREEATSNELPEPGIVAAQPKGTGEAVRTGQIVAKEAAERAPSNALIGKAPEAKKPTGSEQLPADAAVPQEVRRLSHTEQLEAFFKKRKEDLMKAASPEELKNIINSNPFADDLFSPGNRKYEIPGENSQRPTEVSVREMIQDIEDLAAYVKKNGFNENTQNAIMHTMKDRIDKDPDVRDALVRVLKNQARSSV